VEFVFGDMANFSGGESGDLPEILDEKVHDYLRHNPVNPARMLECLLKVNLIPTSSVLFKKSCLQSVGLMNEEFIHCEDYEYWLRFAENSRMGFVARMLVRRRLHGSNAMNDAYVQNCEATLKLLKCLGQKDGLSTEAGRTLLHRIASVQYDLASDLIKRRRFKDAATQLGDLRSEDLNGSLILRLKVLLKYVAASCLG
jgi:hypothetical protein